MPGAFHWRVFWSLRGSRTIDQPWLLRQLTSSAAKGTVPSQQTVNTDHVCTYKHCRQIIPLLWTASALMNRGGIKLGGIMAGVPVHPPRTSTKAARVVLWEEDRFHPTKLSQPPRRRATVVGSTRAVLLYTLALRRASDHLGSSCAGRSVSVPTEYTVRSEAGCDESG